MITLDPTNKRPLYVFVDVDDTFVRSFGSKRVPIPNVLRHVRELASQGAILYCWSSGGADYAQQSAAEFEIEDCFVGFLPKPNVLVDDQAPSHWKDLLHVAPCACEAECVESYERALRWRQ